MTTEETTGTWSSREQQHPPHSTGSMYTRHSAYSAITNPRYAGVPPKTSYMPSRSAQHHTSSHHIRKRNETRRYTINDFLQAFEKKGMELDTSKKLGRGKYSKVYKAVDKANNRLVAVKAIDIHELTADVKTKFLPREISCWRKLKNPFIVGLHAQYEAQNMIFLSMEERRIEESKAGRFMSQLMRGLQYMHTKQIAHRDIKLENIILFDDCVKLSDFGFVRTVDSQTVSHTFCGSKSYSAPELLRGIGYNPFLSDVWSLGVVGFVMVTNRMPFDEKKPNHMIVELQRNRQYVIPPTVFLSHACISSFELMMTFDVRGRPNSTQCLCLPWISPHIEVSDRRCG
ncbi:unnamed protein product [Caenorhabditis sp. 36 PRJEB53466]|nr:unnamed protein product [Caenorhabditis sp. 36 PRJEB53466]